MLDEKELANVLHNVLGQKEDGFGNPTPTSRESQAYASGIVAALKAGSVANASGTITGTTAPGSPLVAGSGTGGVLTIDPGPMLEKTLNGFDPVGPLLSIENKAVIEYIATGLATFAPGTVTGTCTSSNDNPGPLAAGAASGGTITGITGSGCLAAVLGATGTLGPGAPSHYNALIDYITNNAEISYSSGSVTGTCPAGGGPLAAGAASGGVIS